MLQADERELKKEQDIESNQLIYENQAREQYLAIMRRTNEIAKSSDFACVCEGMLDLILEVTQASAIHFFQFEVEAEELVLTYLRGDENPRLIGLRVKPDQILLGDLSIEGQQPVVIGDLSLTHHFLGAADPVNSIGKYNMINVPVANRARVLGVVQIFNYQHVDLDLLMVLSQRIAIELNHREHLSKSDQSNRRLKSLIGVLGEIAGTLDRNQLLHSVTEYASRLVNAERTSLYLVDPESKDTLFQVSYENKEGDTNLPFATKTEDDSSIQNSDLSNHDDSDFKYFNRSAITMPIKSSPLTHDQSREQNHVLGGLMALTKNNKYFRKDDARLIQILANQTSTFLQVAEMYEGAEDLFIGVIKSLVAAIDAKDPYTQGHSQRVSDLSALIARELNLSGQIINDIRIGSLLHDIGKIGIPDQILLKKGKLSDDEYEIIKRHPATGVNILGQVQLLEPMLPAIAEHHERLDGSGYPNQLVDSQISLKGKIVMVADVFDAMTSHRPYRDALSVNVVLSFLEGSTGKLFDRECVQALFRVIARSQGEWGDTPISNSSGITNTQHKS